MSAGDSLPVLSMDAAFDAPADVVSPQQVEWRGVDWHQVLAFALMWEVVWASANVYVAAYSFLGYLFCDLFHLVTHFPTLGGMDMLLHHVCFILLTCLGAGYTVAVKAYVKNFS